MSPVVRERTAPGRGGIAIVSVEGPGARALVGRLLAGREAPRPGALALLALSADGEALDEALVSVASEDRVELGLHGSPAVVTRVRARLLRLGGREPTAAATLAERARAALATAPSEAAARILLDQAEGALADGLRAAAAAPPDEARRAVQAMLERARWLDCARRPRTVVLAGPANAGKSTLFNVLLGRTRVVVSADEGTTRDLVRERARLGAWPVELVDTAGDRPVGEPGGVEARGQALALEERAAADLVLWLDPRGRAAPPGAVLVVSRAGPGAAPGPPAIAALERPAEAGETVARLFREALELPDDPWQPGRPVPFDDEDVRALRQGLDDGDPGAAARRLVAEGEA